ncbi:MAG: glutathionylspermidine synthase family protein [Pseudomonadota bacterium]|nr:glutathionylspermidine synthase family protein [Pseudomonadota bacterium]
MRRVPIEPRPDWKDQAERLGFHFHTIEGETYWDESAYYAFSLEQVEDDIETATQAVHDMAMQLVDEVVQSEELLQRIAIPETYWDWIRASWQGGDPHLYGRMDLAYDGTGPAKLYELNYDTPTSLYEAAYFQWLWLEQQIAAGHLPAGADQLNRIQELLCETLATLSREERIGQVMHFASAEGSIEDRATVQYLQDCAHQVGIRTAAIDIENIGISRDGWFTDLEDNVIQTLFKLYPLEFMFEETFGQYLPANRMQLVEPAWKAVLSNKGILPLLWERHQGHPNLLPARFDTAGSGELSPGWVRKPLFSREGANVELVTAQGERMSSPGPYGDSPSILQAYHPLPVFDGHYPLIGSWVIADQPAGMGVREDSTLITRDTSRFIPHAIV